MKKPLLLLLLLLVASLARVAAQAPAWQQAFAASSNLGGSTVAASATDAAGNVFVAGQLAGSITLGATTLVVNSYSDPDMFVAKWTPGQGFVWALQAGGDGADWATGLAINGSSLYVGGNFRSGEATFGTTTLRNSGSADVFIAKLTDLSTSARFAWVQQAGGAGDDLTQALTASGPNIYAVGTFGSTTANFGDQTLSTANYLTYSCFITKLTDNGNTGSFSWAQQAGGVGGYDEARAVAVSGTAVYVAGGFRSPSATFGPVTLRKSGTSGADVFVTKLLDAGSSASFTWAQRAGGAGSDLALGLGVAGTSVVVVGDFDSDRFEAGSSGVANHAPGSYDGFVAKLTDAGSTASFAWVQGLGGSQDDYCRAVALRGASIYVAGSFTSSTANFGSTTLANSTLSGGLADLFVTRLVDAGATSRFTWTQTAGGPGNDRAFGVLLQGATVYVTGGIGSTATFGSQTLTNSGGTFVASLLDTTLPAAMATASPASSLYPNPASASTRVLLPGGATSASLTLLDARGQAVRTVAAQLAGASQPYQLDLRGLASGLYLLRIVPAGQAGTTQRLLVE
jgi:hypothetical protein